MANESATLGLPVEIGAIDRELKRVWAEGEGAKTRASLINLAIYSERADSLTENTQLISQVTESHACRAIVIAANPSAKSQRTEAWISAHCHLRGGAKQVCSEQISFLLKGKAVQSLPSVVFAQLDSDLPLYLWWQADFPEPMDPQLWSWVDRLIYDSAAWRTFEEQMQRVETAQREAKHRIVLCDLNWTRLVHFRLAFAQFFDHCGSHHHFGKIERVAIEFGEGYKSTALLLAGWLGAQLGWELHDKPVCFRNDAEKKISLQLSQKGKAPISSLRAKSSGVEFVVKRAACDDLLEVCRQTGTESVRQQLMPVGGTDAASLLSEELIRGGRHEIYLRAVAKARPLFNSRE